MRDVFYLYLISSDANDYVTTSFSWNKSIIDQDYIELNILSFFEENCDKYEFVVFDSTSGNRPNVYYDDPWQNSQFIKFYKIINRELDNSRGTLELLIREADPIDLQSYRRDCKIRQVIDPEN